MDESTSDPSASAACDIDVESGTIRQEYVDRALATGSQIVVLPIGPDTEGTHIYSEASVMLVKELRAFGGDAAFAHPSAERAFEVKKSAEILVAWVIGIASTAAWDLIKAFLAKRDESKMSVTFVELEEGDRRGTSWTVEGDAEQVVRIVDKVRRTRD